VSTRDCYEKAWASFKRFLQRSSVCFYNASVDNVLDYLVHLHGLKLVYSTINTHRSAISMTLAPVDSSPIGENCQVTPFMRGIFNLCPPKRKAPQVWDPERVLNVFRHWPLPLPLSHLIQKGVFLISIVSS
jgi:hypothetical protein